MACNALNIGTQLKIVEHAYCWHPSLACLIFSLEAVYNRDLHLIVWMKHLARLQLCQPKSVDIIPSVS